jgi:Flp pilus assembly protein TadG
MMARVIFKEKLKGLRPFVREERGTQLVELALVLPLLLLLFAATAEFGRYFYTYTTLAKATRAGARYLASYPVDKSRVNPTKDAEALKLVVYGDHNAAAGSNPITKGLTTGNVKITRAGGSGSIPETVKVEIINYKYTPLFNLGELAGGLSWVSVPVKPSTTMRHLQTQPSI